MIFETDPLDETFRNMKQEVMLIADLRTELGLSLEALGAKVGIASRGRMSVIERENRCSLDVALALEKLSDGRLDAASICDDVRRARASSTEFRTHGPESAVDDDVLVLPALHGGADSGAAAGASTGQSGEMSGEVAA